MGWAEAWPQRLPEATAAPPASGRGWPRVSLVTPALNQAGFLEQALLSVFQQHYPDLEYLVFDGGSTDGSVEILRRCSPQLAHWESGPDLGQSDAVNKGWRRSSGEYLWWLNGDDMLAPAALFTSVRYLEDHPEVDLVFGDLLRIDEDGRVVEHHRPPDFDLGRYVLQGHHVSQAGALMRRSVLDRIGYLDPDLHFLMDTDYWIRLALAGGRIVHLPEVLALFRVHAGSKTQGSSARAVEERYVVIHRILDSELLPRHLGERRRRILGRMHLSCGREYAKIGRYRQSFGEIWQAVRTWPPLGLQPYLVWHVLLAGLGLLVGHRAWLRARSLLRRLRRLGYE